jgi:hypothetical protein
MIPVMSGVKFYLVLAANAPCDLAGTRSEITLEENEEVADLKHPL